MTEKKSQTVAFRVTVEQMDELLEISSFQNRLYGDPLRAPMSVSETVLYCIKLAKRSLLQNNPELPFKSEPQNTPPPPAEKPKPAAKPKPKP